MTKKELDEKVNFISSAKCNHTQHMYIDITEDLVQGTLLARILYWFSPDKDNKSKVRIFKDGYFWIAKQRKDWWEEIRITERQYDKAIKELERKGFVVLAKYKFDSMPTIHIRPEYEKINSATEKWKNELKKEIIEENKRDLHKSKNGNDTKCNSHGNNTKCKTGITQSGNPLTYITNTDYNNTDYRTDNTDMYAFSEDKSSSKGNMYAFQSGDCKVEKPEKESRYIPEDYTEEQLVEHIKEPIVERFKESYGLDEKSEEYKDLLETIILFYRTYQQKTGKRHRVLSDVAYKRIVTRYMAVPKTTHSYMRYDYDIYSELVPMYFETNYAKDTAYDISHFMSDKIRGNLFERSGLY